MAAPLLLSFLGRSRCCCCCLGITALPFPALLILLFYRGSNVGLDQSLTERHYVPLRPFARERRCAIVTLQAQLRLAFDGEQLVEIRGTVKEGAKTIII